MTKNSPITHSVFEKIQHVESYLKSRKDILFAYLFGSFACGKVHPLSDVDIAVYLDGVDISEKRLEIQGNLTDILKTDEVDLVILNTDPLTLQIKILQNRKILADNQPFKRHIYESMTVRIYLDFFKLEKRMLERRFLNG